MKTHLYIERYPISHFLFLLFCIIWAQVLSGNSHDPKVGLWMIKISKICMQKKSFFIKSTNVFFYNLYKENESQIIRDSTLIPLLKGNNSFGCTVPCYALSNLHCMYTVQFSLKCQPSTWNETKISVTSRDQRRLKIISF